MTKPAEYIMIIRLPRTSSYLFVLHNKSSLQSRRQPHLKIRFCWVWNMKTHLSVALVFVLCGKGIETVATDCINRREFDDFKANVFNRIQELTMKNEKQAKQIEYQKKAFLDLKRLLTKYDMTSIYVNQNDTAVTSNQSLPGEPSMLSTNDSMITKPRGKREAMRMCFYFYGFLIYLKNVVIISYALLKKS